MPIRSVQRELHEKCTRMHLDHSKFGPLCCPGYCQLVSFLAFSNDLHYISNQIPFFRLWWVVSNKWHVEVNTSGRVSRKKIGNDVQNIYCACNRAYTHTHTNDKRIFSYFDDDDDTLTMSPSWSLIFFFSQDKGVFCSDEVFCSSGVKDGGCQNRPMNYVMSSASLIIIPELYTD